MAKPAEPGALPGAVLEITRRRGTVTRIELADELGVTPATITQIVRPMLRDGLLAEIGYRESTGGKRPRVLAVIGKARYAIGISYGFQFATTVLTDLNGEMVGASLAPVPPAGVPSAETVVRDVRSFIDAMGVARADLVGVGLSANSGDPDRAIERLGSSVAGALALPVVCADAAACAALGEYWTGDVDETTRFATVYLADHLSAGFIDAGHSIALVGRGFGHMSVDHLGAQCRCGSRGCVDLVASPAGVVAAALAQGGLSDELGLSGDPARRRQDFDLVAAAAVQGHRAARSLIEASARAIGWSIVDMAALLGLHRVFLAGPGFAIAGALYERVIHETTAGVTVLDGAEALEVRLSHLDIEAAALGAATSAMRAAMPDVAATALA